jgi:hypothetical protein
MLLEIQPTLFDTEADVMLRFEIERQRRSFFVRHNLLEKRCKELEERLKVIEHGLCLNQYETKLMEKHG